MLQMLKKIVFIAWALLLPALASAQYDAMEALRRSQQTGQNPDQTNTNPFAEEGAEEAADTVVRVRKPLESYFFDDSIRALPNFKWTISRDYNRVRIEEMDTTLATWRIDYPFYKKGVGDAALGPLGQASLPYNYFERKEYRDFDFARGYDAYLYQMENAPFYNLKNPYFQFQYLESGQKRYREANFGITLAHNISPTTGFNVNYLSRGTQGLYEWQRTMNHNLSVAFSHTGKRYSVHAGYINNRISTRENGGLVGEWELTDKQYEQADNMPTRLGDAEAQNEYRNNAFYLVQSIGIPLLPVTESDFSIAQLPAVYFGHSFEYNAWSKQYRDRYATYTDQRYERNPNYDPEDDRSNPYIARGGLEYYGNWYIDPQNSRDSLYERVISNRLFVQAQPWDRNGVVGTLNGGVGLDMHTYSQFDMGKSGSYLTGKYAKVKKQSYFFYGSVEGKIKRYVDWGGDVKYYPAGYRGGDLSFGANLTLTGFIRQKPLVLEGRFRTETRSPGYWQENLFSNHYVWNTPLNKEKETRFEVSFRIPDFAFEVGLWQGIVTDKIYYDYHQTDKLTETGFSIWDTRLRQNSGTTSVTSVYARKDFRIAGLHLDHKVLLQWSTNQEVIPVPFVSAFLSYYYEFWVVREHNALKAQFGVDVHFNTRYYAPGYNPALAQFINQQRVLSGNYPYVDIFLVGKWKRARVFLKYQHFNKGLFGNQDYFAISKYPLNPGMFKFGISWGFYD